MTEPILRLSGNGCPLWVFAALACSIGAGGELAAALPNFPLEEKYWRKKAPEPDPADLPPGDYNFPYPVNPIGWSDYDGSVSIWVNGDWKIHLGGGVTLPLRFKFSSAQNRIEDGLLGEGWWVPLLESRVLLRYDGSVRITALGGESKYVYHHREQPGKLRSRDRKWQAVGKIEGRLEVSGPGGWSYRYEQGRIVRAVSPGGREVRWIYDKNDRVEALVGREGECFLDLSLNDEGRIESLRLAGGESFEVGYRGIPTIPNEGGAATYNGLIVSASTLTEVDPSGRSAQVFSFRISADQDGNYHSRYMGTRSDGRRELTRLEWSSRQGMRILSDGASTYRFDRWIDGVGVRSGAIMRAFSADEREFYYYDAQNRVDIRIRRDGSVWERSYHRRSGPAYMKLARTREGRYVEGRVTFRKEKRYHYDEFGERIPE